MTSKLEITQCIKKASFALGPWPSNSEYSQYVGEFNCSCCRYGWFPGSLLLYPPVLVSLVKACHSNTTFSLAGVPNQSTVDLATSVCVALITTANGSTTVWERGITGKSLVLWQEHIAA